MRTTTERNLETPEADDDLLKALRDLHEEPQDNLEGAKAERWMSLLESIVNE